jgi:hypothetical protein
MQQNRTQRIFMHVSLSVSGAKRIQMVGLGLLRKWNEGSNTPVSVATHTQTHTDTFMSAITVSLCIATHTIFQMHV